MPTIAELLFDAEKGQIHIPEFQRPWVWNRDKVRKLFTSLYRRYPVGAMVFWPNRTPDHHRLSLIDGRQRLTTLYSVIRGQKPPWMSEVPKEFALPLGFDVIDEEFKYLSGKLSNHARWVTVSDVFVIADYVEKFDSEAASRASNGQVSPAAVVQRLAKLQSIRETRINKEMLPEHLDIERAVDVFDILNRAGTPVRESDLVIARLSLVWSGVRDVLDKAMGNWEDAGFRVPTEAVLRCLAAIVANTVSYDGLFGSQVNGRPAPTQRQLVAGFDQLTLATDEVLTKLRGKLAMHREKPTALNRGYVPVVYAAQRAASGALRSISPDFMIGWWQLSNLHNHWSSDVRNRLEAAIVALDRNSDAASLVSLIGKPGRPLTLEPIDFLTKRRPASAEYGLLLTMTKMCGARDLPSGEPLSFNHIGSLSELEAHHIFPRKYLEKQSRWVQREKIDLLANIAFITKRRNLQIRDKAPAEYLSELADADLDNLRSQWIPTDPALWRPSAYRTFLDKRSEMLADQANEFLRGLLGDEAWDAATRR